ncbi:MAG: prolipoprotein diacylglyceryl transferase [Candidatus Hydrothermales bacterium]
MYPELLRIGNFVISSYGVMVAIAFFVGTYLAEKEWIRKGLDRRVFNNVFILALVGAVLGSKLLFIFENIPFNVFISNPIKYLLQRGGFTYYGGFLLSLFLILIYLTMIRHPILKAADAISPPLAIGYAIGRIGCFLVGDDYGKPSNLPWAMAFPRGTPPTYVGALREHFPYLKIEGPEDMLVRVHPTQIYEIIMMFIVFIVLFRLRDRLKEGKLFSLYLILSSLERFLVEFLRITTPSFIPFLTVAQIISILIFILGVFLWKLRK